MNSPIIYLIEFSHLLRQNSLFFLLQQTVPARLYCPGNVKCEMTQVPPAGHPPLRVAVVGAGVCGLPSVKQCLEEGLEPVCFEARPDLGGLWNYSREVVEGWGSVAETTLANTSKVSFSKYVFIFLSFGCEYFTTRAEYFTTRFE